ncbi:MAG: copper chaperone PCu(A)C [Marinibacterium sp.]
MKALKRVLALLLLAAAVAGLTGILSPPEGAGLLVENPRAEATDDGIAVYFTLVNSGGPDRLTGVTSTAAADAAIVADPGITSLAIPAGSSPALAPDGAHIRLSGLSGPPAPGRLIPLTLIFEEAGEIRFQARLGEVGPASVAGGPDADAATGGTGMESMIQMDDSDHGAMVYRVPDGQAAPRLSMAVRPEADGWTVLLTAQHFAFAPDLADGPAVAGTGHGHLYLDGLKLGRVYGPEFHIGALLPGRYTLRVTLNTNDHRIYADADGPVSASAVIAVR